MSLPRSERYYREMFALMDERRKTEPGYMQLAEQHIVMDQIAYLDFDHDVILGEQILKSRRWRNGE
jgi:hypothetical protein